jgi:hypothetical protein
MSGARITQRHVASAEDLAYAEGKGLLVPLEEVDDPLVSCGAAVQGEVPTGRVNPRQECSTAQHSTAQHNTAQHGTAQCNAARRSAARGSAA